MELKTLKYFVTIVEEGNISKAAKKLFMSQPPLSNQMKNLENELGVTLFERGTQTIVLTDEGKLLYEKAKDILLYSDNIVTEIKDVKNYQKGKIRIGLVSSVGELFIKEYLSLFFKENKIDFEIIEGNTYSLLEKVQNGFIDLAIVRTPFQTINLKVIPIQKERIVLIDKEDISLDRIIKNGLIVYRRWIEIVKEELEKKNIESHFCFINDDARTTLSLVDQGLGIGVVPESIIQNKKKDYYINDQILDINSEICAIYHPDKYHNHSFDLFLNVITQKKA